MEHKITLEVIIKFLFIKPKQKDKDKVHAIQINPSLIQSLVPQLMNEFQKSLPKELKKPKKGVQKLK